MIETDKRSKCSGLILAGGKSRRMGRDKACICVGGQTMLSLSLALARQFCDIVAISGRERDVAALPKLDPADSTVLWMPDIIPGLGPIGGIVTGLTRLQTPVLVLPCDLPLMRPALIRQLLEAHAQRPASTVATAFRQTDTGFLEPLVAVYEFTALPLLRQAIDKKVWALVQALPTERWHSIPLPPDEKMAFLNINHQEDLEQLPLRSRTDQPTPSGFKDSPCTELA